MMVRLQSADLVGIDAVPVEVEVDVQPGMPSYVTVGLPDAAVRESRERVKGALLNAGYAYPLEQVTVNLAPADIRKEGSQLDLPIALALLAATGQVGLRQGYPDHVIVGELGLLNGVLRPVAGACSPWPSQPDGTGPAPSQAERAGSSRRRGPEGSPRVQPRGSRGVLPRGRRDRTGSAPVLQGPARRAPGPPGSRR